MDDRKKALELIAKGKLDLEKLIDPNQTIYNRALDARDLTQSALAKQVLDNTGIPIPSSNARASTLEDFFQRLSQETHPELKNMTVDLADLSKENARGMYYSGDNQKWIELQKNLWKQNPESAVGTLMHELGHAYDDQVLGKDGKPISTNLKLPNSMNAGDAYEIMSNKHHVENIPGKRGVGSFAKGALESLKNNGTFRALGPLSAISQVTPTLADLKEGNTNTAAARMITSLAPPGTGDLDQQLMQEAAQRDNSPELSDPGYLQTIKNIGERRMREGRSPVVESFSGQKVDTSATEESDFANKVNALRKLSSQG